MRGKREGKMKTFFTVLEMTIKVHNLAAAALVLAWPGVPPS